MNGCQLVAGRCLCVLGIGILYVAMVDITSLWNEQSPPKVSERVGLSDWIIQVFTVPMFFSENTCFRRGNIGRFHLGENVDCGKGKDKREKRE
jgi:hypothetical protein